MGALPPQDNIERVYQGRQFPNRATLARHLATLSGVPLRGYAPLLSASIRPEISPHMARIGPHRFFTSSKGADMPTINRIADFHREMAEWRQDLHAHPELGLQEKRTSGVVQAKLKEFGVDEIISGLANTGVVGVIRGHGASQRAVGLRADMDALPIVEETGASYASQNHGVMHACGHDGHTAMLLGAAKYLAETRNFAGTVYVIFQPAEEGLGGGRLMVREGVFERCPMEMVFGMHNWPQLPAGTFGWRDGPIMAGGANPRDHHHRQRRPRCPSSSWH